MEALPKNQPNTVDDLNSNPYVWLGFFPNQRPSDAEVKSRFHRLAFIHHPDFGGDPEVFQAILGAYQKIRSQGILKREPTEPGLQRHQSGGEWSENSRGNWVYRLQGEVVGTVFRKGASWCWVADDIYSKRSYTTVKEAMEGFLSR